MRTSNIQLRKLSRARHPTSNVQWRKRAWLSSLCALLVVAQSALSEEVAVAESSRFRADAIFGAGEMLRALERREEALQKFLVLFRDKQWGTQARLRSAELDIDKGDAVNARRVLDEMQPKSAAERKERRFLRGRLEVILQRPERAIGTFQALLKRF